MIWSGTIECFLCTLTLILCLSLTGFPAYSGERHLSASGSEYSLSALGRTFFVHDDRIAWTGLEVTFGVEGAVSVGVHRRLNGWSIDLVSDIAMQQPYDANILVDSRERQSYRGNFEFSSFNFSQLYIKASTGGVELALGKKNSPFGKTFYPVLTNRMYDAPFIRTEVINDYETGLYLNYSGQLWRVVSAVVNGCDEMDTNSSKAVMLRTAWQLNSTEIGGSAKWQDGIGSENQKIRNNMVGIDGHHSYRNWTVSFEMLYDTYGFRRFFDPLEITWGRSLYHRDQYYAKDVTSGFGYYLNLDYRGDRWSSSWNIGSYRPHIHIGDSVHDRKTRRFIGKLMRQMTAEINFVSIAIAENAVDNAQDGRYRKGSAWYFGLEYHI